jgi:hypothetical protein
LAEAARKLRPGIRLLFTSGYSSDAQSTVGGVAVPMLAKPYQKLDLAAKVRAALQTPVLCES